MRRCENNTAEVGSGGKIWVPTQLMVRRTGSGWLGDSLARREVCGRIPFSRLPGVSCNRALSEGQRGCRLP
jgi:hypothetical protein